MNFGSQSKLNYHFKAKLQKKTDFAIKSHQNILTNYINIKLIMVIGLSGVQFSL